jgi:hypothetical protein
MASMRDEEELRDFCSLLTLADRVLIASPDADATPRGCSASSWRTWTSSRRW